MRFSGPPPGPGLKREKGTWIWVEDGPNGIRRVVKLYRLRSRFAEHREEVLGFRAEREYRHLKHLRAAGVPCTEPLAWTHGYNRAHGWHEALITREVPGAHRLDRYLEEQGTELDLAPLLRTIRRMHDSGFCHQTLYARNILVASGSPEGERFFIMDVPRGRIFPESIVGNPGALADLRDLFVDLTEAGITRAAIPWEAYGLDSEGLEQVTRPWKGDPRTKGRRTVRDVKLRVRWAIAWLLAPFREPDARAGSPDGVGDVS